MRAAQDEQVLQGVAASGFTGAEMMHVDERRVAAARHLAAVPIAQQHGTADGRRNRLRSALRMGPGARLPLARAWPTHVGFVTRAWPTHVGFFIRAWPTHVGFVAAIAIALAPLPAASCSVEAR